MFTGIGIGASFAQQQSGTLAGRLTAAAGESAYSLYLGSDTTTNGSGRFSWTDLWGARHLESPGASNDPTTGTGDDLGGLDVVTFDGAATYLQSIAPASDYDSLSDGTECAILLLVENTTGTFQDIGGTADSNSETGVRFSINTGGTFSSTIYNGTTLFNSTSDTSHQSGRISYLSLNSSSELLARDNGKQGTAATVTPSVSGASNTLTIGRRPGTSLAYLDGNIAALVILVKDAGQTSNEFESQIEAVRDVLISEAFATDPINVVCFGNSLTFGIGASNEDRYSYPAQLASLMGGRATVSNVGSPGIETDEMLASSAVARMARANNVMVLWEGGNHIQQSDVSSATALAAYSTLIDQCLSLGWYGPIVGPTITNRTSFSASHLTAVSEFNAAIQASPTTYGLTHTVDLAAIGSLDPPADDGTHFDDDQYGTIAAAIQPVVEARWPSAVDAGMNGVLGASMFQWSRADDTGTNGSGRLQITDRTGDGRHWDAASASEEAVTGTDSELNDQAILVYDGTDDRSTNISPVADWAFLHDTTVKADVWIVGELRDTHSLNFATLLANSNSAGNPGVRFLINTSTGLTWNVSNGSNYIDVACAYSVGDAFIFHVTLNTDGSLDAECITSGATTTDTDTRTAPSASDPALSLVIGDRPASSSEVELDFAEIIFAQNAEVTREEAVTELLRQRYDLAGE